jgi:hypothetical protein
MPQEIAVLRWVEETKVGVVVNELTRLPADLIERVNACKDALAALRGQTPAVWTVAHKVRSLLKERCG